MPIQVEILDNRERLVVRCDECDELIEDRDGLFMWAVTAEGRVAGDPITGELVYVHVGCQRTFQHNRDPTVAWYWDSLEALPFRLLAALGFLAPEVPEALDRHRDWFE